MWKDIAGYEGRYQVSDDGQVKSCEHYHKTLIKGKETLRHRKEQLLKQWKRSKYLLVDLWKNGKRDVRSVHVLVYETFKGAVPDGQMIHHIDANKFNNNIDNLTTMTVLEHNRHHHNGQEPWNKGMKYREIVLKAWKTRKEKMKCLMSGQNINSN